MRSTTTSGFDSSALVTVPTVRTMLMSLQLKLPSATASLKLTSRDRTTVLRTLVPNCCTATGVGPVVSMRQLRSATPTSATPCASRMPPVFRLRLYAPSAWV